MKPIPYTMYYDKAEDSVHCVCLEFDTWEEAHEWIRLQQINDAVDKELENYE